MNISTTQLDGNNYLCDSLGKKYAFTVDSVTHYGIKYVSNSFEIDEVSIMETPVAVVVVTAGEDNFAYTDDSIITIAAGNKAFGIVVDGVTISGVIEIE